MTKQELYEEYFNDPLHLSSSDDIVNDTESIKHSDFIKYNYSIKVEIRIIYSNLFRYESTFAKAMKMFISKCSYDLDNMPFINDVGNFIIEQNDENGVYDPGPNNHELVFDGVSILCNEDTYKEGKTEAPSNLYRLWCTIPIDADIKNARQVYRLFKYFYCAKPFWKNYARFFNCLLLIDNKTHEFGIVSLDYDNHKQEYNFKEFSTFGEELYGFCQSIFSDNYLYSDMLRDLRINDADYIFKNYFFDGVNDYEDKIHYIGHFDKLHPCSNPNKTYAYNKYPVCNYGLLFFDMGEHDCTPAVDFSKKTYRYDWLNKYCLNHSFSVYFLNCTSDAGEDVDKAVLIFDGMVQESSKEQSIVLVGDEESDYSMIKPVDVLSCVMPYETAKDVVAEYGHTPKENEDDYDE